MNKATELNTIKVSGSVVSAKRVSSMSSFSLSICERLRQLCRELLQTTTKHQVRVVRVEMEALLEALQSELNKTNPPT